MIAGVYVVASKCPTDLPASVTVLVDGGGGLNAALAQAAQQLAAEHPEDAVVALLADLPALRPAELLDVLRQALAVRRGFVADADGSGTTMLTASSGTQLAPAFGVESARRHRESGALELNAGPGARRDVDTAADLEQCLVLGVGEHTAGMVAHLL
jgi:2-phospho-L-lactate guanylyltransferase